MINSMSNPGTSILFSSAWFSTALSMLNAPSVRISTVPKSAFLSEAGMDSNVYPLPRNGRFMSGYPMRPCSATNAVRSAEPVRLIKDGAGLRASPSQLEGVKRFVARQEDGERLSLALEGEITDYPDLLNALMGTEKYIGFTAMDCNRALLRRLKITLPELYGGISESIGSDRFHLYTLHMNHSDFGHAIVGVIDPRHLSLPAPFSFMHLILDMEARKFVTISRRAVVTVSVETLKQDEEYLGVASFVLRVKAPNLPGKTFLDVLMSAMRKDFEATSRFMYDMLDIDIWIDPLVEDLELPAANGGEALPRALIEAGFLGNVEEGAQAISEFLMHYYGADRLASIAKRHGLSDRIPGSKSAKMKRKVDDAPISKLAVTLGKILGTGVSPELLETVSEVKIADAQIEWLSWTEGILKNINGMIGQHLLAIHDSLLQKYERAWESIDPKAGKEAFFAVAEAFSDDLSEAFRACAILEELLVKVGMIPLPSVNTSVVARAIASLVLTKDMEEVYIDSMILNLMGKPARRSRFMVLDDDLFGFNFHSIDINEATKTSLARFIEENVARLNEAYDLYEQNEDLRIEQNIDLARVIREFNGTYNPLKRVLRDEMADEASRRELVESVQGDDSLKGRLIRSLSHLIDGNLNEAGEEIDAAMKAIVEGQLTP